jgi:hypothetical protein
MKKELQLEELVFNLLLEHGQGYFEYEDPEEVEGLEKRFQIVESTVVFQHEYEVDDVELLPCIRGRAALVGYVAGTVPGIRFEIAMWFTAAGFRWMVAHYEDNSNEALAPPAK